MILDGEFFSGGHLRWNLGWPTPNYAGAFLATVLALAFAFSGSRWRWATLTVETGGLFLLAKTYSRGAVVAWGLAWLFGVLASRGWRDPGQRVVWMVRVGVLTVMILAVGFGWSRAGGSGDGTRGTSTSAAAKLWRDKSDGPTGERVAGIKQSGVELATEDGSVVNRLVLWRGGLKMIAAAPLTGWGAGESGRAYMNWYQDLDRDEGYATMVNSYLHVAVEHGLPLLAVVLWVGVWLLATAWSGARDGTDDCIGRAVGITRSTLAAASGASLVAWMAANIFTTLWIEPRLWILPAVVGIWLAWNVRRTKGPGLGSLTGVSMVAAVFAAGGLYSVGLWLLGSQPLSCIPGGNVSVVLASVGPAREIWHAWPDPAVLGATPGKEFRRWLYRESTDVRLIVHRVAPLQPGEAPAAAKGVMLFGRQAERLGRDFSLDCRELWLIHPSGAPPLLGELANQPSPKTTVILPQIDEVGNSLAWRRWAAYTDAQIIESLGSGQDIRAVWPISAFRGIKP